MPKLNNCQLFCLDGTDDVTFHTHAKVVEIMRQNAKALAFSF